MEFIKHCFVCGCLIDESNFETTQRDGRHICSEKCVEEYLSVGTLNFKNVKENMQKIKKGCEWLLCLD